MALEDEESAVEIPVHPRIPVTKFVVCSKHEIARAKLITGQGGLIIRSRIRIYVGHKMPRFVQIGTSMSPSRAVSFRFSA